MITKNCFQIKHSLPLALEYLRVQSEAILWRQHPSLVLSAALIGPEVLLICIQDVFRMSGLLQILYRHPTFNIKVRRMEEVPSGGQPQISVPGTSLPPGLMRRVHLTPAFGTHYLLPQENLACVVLTEPSEEDRQLRRREEHGMTRITPPSRCTSFLHQVDFNIAVLPDINY